MKRWMALLLCCLLCLCAAGATAEGAVTIEFRSDNSWVYDIYPNGYVKSKGGSEAQFWTIPRITDNGKKRPPVVE